LKRFTFLEQISAMDTRVEITDSGQREYRSMMMCGMSMCSHLGRGGPPM